MNDCMAIFAARGGSRRLKRKNIVELFGRPLLAWAVDACRETGRIGSIYVSSEDEEILSVATELGCRTLVRPPALAEDAVPKMEVIRHVYRELVRRGECVEQIVIPQASSPDLRASDIARGLDMMDRHKLWEVFSVDEEGVQNAAFRIIRTSALFNTFLGAHMGVVRTPCVDVHTAEDLERVRAQFGTMDRFLAYRRE